MVRVVKWFVKEMRRQRIVLCRGCLSHSPASFASEACLQCGTNEGSENFFPRWIFLLFFIYNTKDKKTHFFCWLCLFKKHARDVCRAVLCVHDSIQKNQPG